MDILTGTLGKALGGASGGYTAGPHEEEGQKRADEGFGDASVGAVIRAHGRPAGVVEGGAERRRRHADTNEKRSQTAPVRPPSSPAEGEDRDQRKEEVELLLHRQRPHVPQR